MKRPTGSNADEWALFLEEYEGGRSFIAVQIAEAIEAAERDAIERYTADMLERGWKMLPVKRDGKAGLTHEMCHAFWHRFDDVCDKHGLYESTNAAYNALVSAAPIPSGTEG